MADELADKLADELAGKLADELADELADRWADKWADKFCRRFCKQVGLHIGEQMGGVNAIAFLLTASTPPVLLVGVCISVRVQFGSAQTRHLYKHLSFELLLGICHQKEISLI